MSLLPCRCPHCRAPFQIPGDLHAKRSRCPRCHAELRLSSAHGKTTVVLLEWGENVREQETALRIDAPQSKTEKPPTLLATESTSAKAQKRRDGFPWWLLAIIFPGGIVFCCGGLGIMMFFLLGDGRSVSSANKNENIAGKYPEPASRFKGWGAEHYYEMVLDTDKDVCSQGCDGLHGLGKEGIPFLLRGIIRFQKTEQGAHLACCVYSTDGHLVDPVDLPLFLPLLKVKSMWLGQDVRSGALHVLRQAGKASQEHLAVIRAAKEEGDIIFSWKVQDLLHFLDPGHEADPGPRPRKLFGPYDKGKSVWIIRWGDGKGKPDQILRNP